MKQIGGTAPTNLSPHKTSSQVILFKKGQIFEGQVLKLFPNSMAALRLGKMNVTARLEAALTAGERYLFQVKQNDGVPRLKVLETGDSALKAQRGQSTAAHVLRALGISDNKINQTMVRLFQNEQMPFSKEMIAEGGEILKNAQALHQEGGKILSMMNQKHLPMTLSTFQALFEAEHGPSLSSQIHTLEALLRQAETQVSTNREAAAIKELMHQVLKTMSLSKGEELEINDTSKAFLHLFRLAGQSKESVKEGAISLLQRVNLLPPSMSTEEGLQSFKNGILTMSHEERQQLLPAGGQKSIEALKGMEPKDLFQTIMKQLPSPSRDNAQQLLTLLHSASKGTPKPMITEEQLNTMAQRLNILEQDNVLSSAEKQILSVILQNGMKGMTEGEQSGSAVAKQFASLIKQLGIQHESILAKHVNASQGANVTSPPDSLKQTILQQIQHLPAMVQDNAESLLHKITGQQIQMQEQHGLLQQAVLQIPLQLGGHKTDLTVQWEGKKCEDGSFHPDHCRMLFYLHMENIGETIADVQIQNRHVVITVFNDNKKPVKLINMLQPVLKEKLYTQDYTLSSVTWKQVGEQSAALKDKEVYSSYAGWEGVDIRI